MVIPLSLGFGGFAIGGTSGFGISAPTGPGGLLYFIGTDEYDVQPIYAANYNADDTEFAGSYATYVGLTITWVVPETASTFGLLGIGFVALAGAKRRLA